MMMQQQAAEMAQQVAQENPEAVPAMAEAAMEQAQQPQG